MPVIPPLPGSLGAGTAASRGVREEVNRQFAVSAAAAGPPNMCWAAIHHLVQGSLRLATSRTTPSLRKGPVRAAGSPHSRKEELCFS